MPKVRRTQNGGMLVLQRGKEATQLEAGIKNALNDKTCVRSLAPMVTVAKETAVVLKQQLAIYIDHKDIKV